MNSKPQTSDDNDVSMQVPLVGQVDSRGGGVCVWEGAT